MFSNANSVPFVQLPFGRRPSTEEWLISVITNGNILYLVTFKWLLTGAYGLPHTFNALTQYISYFNCLVYNVFFFFFSSQNFRRGSALAPCIDAPPLPLPPFSQRKWQPSGNSSTNCLPPLRAQPSMAHHFLLSSLSARVRSPKS